MSEHPIEGLMNTAMSSIQNMIDVNTIIGEPIETNNNVIIIPVSKVGFGFAAGGSEFRGETINEYNKKEKEEQIQYKLPFGGGAGAGVSINPVAFIVVQQNNVKLLPIEHCFLRLCPMGYAIWTVYCSVMIPDISCRLFWNLALTLRLTRRKKEYAFMAKKGRFPVLSKMFRKRFVEEGFMQWSMWEVQERRPVF